MNHEIAVGIAVVLAVIVVTIIYGVISGGLEVGDDGIGNISGLPSEDNGGPSFASGNFEQSYPSGNDVSIKTNEPKVAI